MHYCKDGGTRATHESSPHLCLPQEPHLQICQEKKLREHRTLEVIIHLKTTELLRFIAYLGQLLGTRPAPVGINRIDPKRRLEKENLELHMEVDRDNLWTEGQRQDLANRIANWVCL